MAPTVERLVASPPATSPASPAAGDTLVVGEAVGAAGTPRRESAAVAAFISRPSTVALGAGETSPVVVEPAAGDDDTAPAVPSPVALGAAVEEAGEAVASRSPDTRLALTVVRLRRDAATADRARVLPAAATKEVEDCAAFTSARRCFTAAHK